MNKTILMIVLGAVITTGIVVLMTSQSAIAASPQSRLAAVQLRDTSYFYHGLANAKCDFAFHSSSLDRNISTTTNNKGVSKAETLPGETSFDVICSKLGYVTNSTALPLSLPVKSGGTTTAELSLKCIGPSYAPTYTCPP
mgnify:CR=1 FL=1|jgi:hypothetical protein